jgi:hypothetical protein
MTSERTKARTIGEAMGLRPLEPVVLKFFNQRELLLGLFQPGSEEAAAMKTIMAAATSANPPRCFRCSTETPIPDMAITGRSASNGPIGFVLVLCRDCVSATEDIRADVVAALGETEIETSILPS